MVCIKYVGLNQNRNTLEENYKGTLTTRKTKYKSDQRAKSLSTSITVNCVGSLKDFSGLLAVDFKTSTDPIDPLWSFLLPVMSNDNTKCMTLRNVVCMIKS